MTKPEVDLSEKVILITGASDGIGKETALALSAMNAKSIIMPCRKSEKASAAYAEVCAKHPTNNGNIILENVDLSDLATIKELVDRLKSENVKLDILINNAGLILNERKVTEDGFEMQFGTNYLGHFLLTELLLKNDMINDNARIINLSSHAMLFGHIDFEDINFERRSYSGWKSYTQSKLANVVYANYLERTHPNLHANSVHPGMVRTKFANNSGLFHILDMVFYPLFYLMSKSPAQGAETTIHVASSPKVEGKGGLYWVNSKPSTWFNSKQSHDEKLQNDLYDFSVKAVAPYLD